MDREPVEDGGPSVLGRLLRGVTATFAARATGAVVNAALLIVLARVALTPATYGRFTVTLAIVGVATLLTDLGVARSTARYLNDYKESRPGQLPHVLRVGFEIRLLLVAVVTVALALGSGTLARLVGMPGLDGALAVGAAYLAFGSLSSFLSVLFQGLNRVVLSAVVATVDSLGRLAFVLGFVGLGAGVAGALLGYAVGAALAVAVGLWLLYARCDTGVPGDRDDGLRRRILTYSLPLTASRGANVVDKRVDVVLVGSLAGSTSAAFYTLARQIGSFLDVPARSLGFAVAPAYGEAAANDRDAAAARLYERSLRYVLLLYVPAAAGVVLVADPAIAIVFGADYRGAVPIVQLVSVVVLFQGVNLVTTQGLDFLGRARDRAIAKGLTAVANLGLNLLLIPPYGGVGAAAATVVTFGLYVLANVLVMGRELPLRVRPVARTGLNSAGITACMGACVAVLVPYAGGVASLVGVVLAGGVLWAILTVATGALDVRALTSTIR